MLQILLRSSSSTSASSSSSFVGPPGGQHYSFPGVLVPENPVHGGSCRKDVISAGAEEGDYGYFSGNAVRGNVSSSSLGGGSENETDDHEYDCDSEEGLEALMDEVPAKPAAPRSSKRSRAAEVHNLSEKRRRSRINEKMKALQNLIPNSNKTDKASMLDEAIDYLKQLQLQVQMLSMRNGISLHPMCLPGLLQPFQLSQFRTGAVEDNSPPHMNMATSSRPLNVETPAPPAMFSFQNHCTSAQQSSSSNLPHALINPETSSFGLESSIKAHFGPFPLHGPSEVCLMSNLISLLYVTLHTEKGPSSISHAVTVQPYSGENVLPHHQLNLNHSDRHPSELASLPFGRQVSNMKDSSGLEARNTTGRDQVEQVLLKKIERNPILSPDLNSIQMGRSAFIGGLKMERRDA
ncbi:hypothetical protein Tsubulata_020634 [Turnera subulata]|uniref:BHLH domain-containing protein n=1 Tax=Turnera subulata TaxID=218843 RepID=A0A9Q0FES3_9ROSI|nr:hypothetical protein Tsubulata_020634 [Turnera subulata]